MTKHKGEYILLIAVAAFLLIVGMLTSCRTQYVPVPETHTMTVEKHDTLLRLDSIFQHDSVIMRMQGDTICKEKYIIRYRDRIVGKTVYRDSVKVDSVRVPYPVERKLNAWERAVLSAAKPVIIVLILPLSLMLLSWLRKTNHK